MLDEGPLVVVQVELLGIVAAQVARHVDEESDAAEKVDDGGENGVIEALGPGLRWRDGGCVHPHAYDCCRELGGGVRRVSGKTWTWLSRTMADDSSQHVTKTGSAIMYLTRLRKCRRRKKLPVNPTARDTPFRVSSLCLLRFSYIASLLGVFQCAHSCGSGIPTPRLSGPAPLSGRVIRHVDTSEASERTWDRGPREATMSGMAVEANHHCLVRVRLVFWVNNSLGRSLTEVGRHWHLGV